MCNIRRISCPGQEVDLNCLLLSETLLGAMISTLATAYFLGDLPYYTTFTWGEAFFCMLIVIFAYVGGIVHGSLGMMLFQHLRRPNTASILIQTNESGPTPIPRPEAEMPMEMPMQPPPRTLARSTPRVQCQVQGVPSAVNAGFTSDTYAYHKGNNPCDNYRSMRSVDANGRTVKKRFEPCKVCWPPAEIPRIELG